MFTARLVGADRTLLGEVRDALANAGCVDTEMTSLSEAQALAESGRPSPDVLVFDLTGSDLRGLRRLAKASGDTPIVVVCDETMLHPALVAGATEGSTKPLRPREFAGRVRTALRSCAEARDRERRERRMSETMVALQREKHELERLVCVDPLTGVANRRHALALLEAEWRRSTREHQAVGIVMIDLDCYHAYNEHYGHLGGDRCLQRLGEAMVRCLRRPSDYIGRYGGEEFLAVLPSTDAVGSKIVAERLRCAIEALGIPHAASSCARVVTITAGFASIMPTRGTSVHKLIAIADAALLRAKAQGRNRIEGDAPPAPIHHACAQPWLRCAPVFADPWFVERIPRFLDDAHDGAREIQRALRAGEPLHARLIAGKLRESARELGLTAVDRLLMDLEDAAAAGSTNGDSAADELIHYVTHVQVIYRRPPETTASPQLSTLT